MYERGDTKVVTFMPPMKLQGVHVRGQISPTKCEQPTIDYN